MFTGSHYPVLDDKGRLVLPAKFRVDLAAGVVLTKGQERSIVVWPAAGFATYAESLTQVSTSNAAVRSRLRVLFSSAFDQVPDRQGRITVPKELREFAGIDREIAVIGNNTRVEIWNLEAWRAYEAQQDADFSDISEEVLPGLI